MPDPEKTEPDKRQPDKKIKVPDQEPEKDPTGGGHRIHGPSKRDDRGDVDPLGHPPV